MEVAKEGAISSFHISVESIEASDDVRVGTFIRLLSSLFQTQHQLNDA